MGVVSGWNWGSDGFDSWWLRISVRVEFDGESHCICREAMECDQCVPG